MAFTNIRQRGMVSPYHLPSSIGLRYLMLHRWLGRHMEECLFVMSEQANGIFLLNEILKDFSSQRRYPFIVPLSRHAYQLNYEKI
jgi:hypothetical protein